MLATTSSTSRKPQSSSSRARREELTSIYSQLPLPPTPPTTPPLKMRLDQSNESANQLNEITPVGCSISAFPGRPSPSTSHRSPPIETLGRLDLDTLTAEDASTRYLSLTPAQLKESRYSVMSTTSTTSQLSTAPSQEASIYSSRATTAAYRSLPSRPTLSPRSALVNHSNLDLSFLDDEPPSPSLAPTPAPAPFPRRPVPRFPVGRVNAPRGSKDITSRIMSTASMYSNTSLDSLEEETKKVMKSIAVRR